MTTAALRPASLPPMRITCLPPGRARSRPAPLTASAAFGWRALLKIKHVPEQLFDVIAIPVVFTLMFTYLFGGALAGSPRRYLQFILPGTLVMAVLLVSMYAGIGLNTDVSKGMSDRFRSLPIWRPPPSPAPCSATSPATCSPPAWSSSSGWRSASARPAGRPACSPASACCWSSRSACPGPGPPSACCCAPRRP